MAKYESFFSSVAIFLVCIKSIIMFSRIFTNGLDHPTRHTHYDGICRNIMRNNSAASDDAIISDCYPRHNNGIKTNMHVIADSNFPKEIDIG